jgi:hypothetical protein
VHNLYHSCDLIEQQPDNILGFCFVLQLSGLALVVLGAVLLSDVPRILLSRLLGSNHMSLQPLFYYIALGLMGVGLVVCATCVLGFWAVCLQSHCLLALVSNSKGAFFCLVVSNKCTFLL